MKEKFVSVKTSLLKYHKSKDINDMRPCISILLENEDTHHVISSKLHVNTSNIVIFDVFL